MKIYKFFILLFVVVLTSCESFNLDLQDDPNQLTLDQSSAELLLNEVQLDFRNIMGGINAPLLPVMRYHNQFSTYADNIDNLVLTGGNGEYAQTYNMRANVALIKGLADADARFTRHYAIARVLESYTLATMVDMLGDIPFEEANQPLEFPHPKKDLGSDIYTALFLQLDEALALLSVPNAEPIQDLFFDNGNASSWAKVANTLKLKMYLNLRLTDPAGATSGIASLLSAGNLIQNANDDFEFAYSNSNSPVESRHPLFRRGYLPGGATGYMSNSFMNQLINGKTNADPRLRYYIYRQADRDPDQPNEGELPCSVSTNPNFVYCYLGNFYWGRDHGSTEGLPADGLFRAVYGVYPAGGAFDDDAGIEATQNEGMQGAGILPIFSSSYMKFMQAEAALMLGTSGDPMNLLVEGITNSMSKVTGFTTVPAAFAATPTTIQAYIDEVSLEYTGAADNDARLNIIMREYYLASFGYAIEAYNGYRRTGFPSSGTTTTDVLQNTVEFSTGFPRSFRYPRSVVDVNINIDDNSIIDPVFWDNNPAGFIE